ncbi:hypothetical protein ABPG75_013930 [Micractinium tetrahymenae]
MGKGLAERAAEIAGRVGRLVGKVTGGGGKSRHTSGGERVVRIARLPTRIYADGPRERAVSAEGLFGLARLTVHEAELDSGVGEGGDPSGSSNSLVAASGKSGSDRRRSRYYAVVSLGQQTFASKRVKRSLPGPKGPVPTSACKRFEWHEGTDVVLQRGGASVAQIAIYKAGRVDGALGDRLQCWCQLDLASYFEGQPGAACPAEAAGTAGTAGTSAGAPALRAEAPAPPPRLLLTVAHTDSESSLGSFSTSEGGEVPAPPAADAGAAAAAQQQEQGGERRAAGAPQCGSSARASAQAGDAPAAAPADGGCEQAPCDGGSSAGVGLQRQDSSGGDSGDGEVLRACWLPLVDPADSTRVLGRVRVTVRASSPAGLEQQLWRRLLGLADLDGNGTLSYEEFEALLGAMGAELDPQEVAALFQEADRNGDGTVDADELAAALTLCHADGDLHRLMRRCPVDGAELVPGDDLANIIYVSLALYEGSGESLQGGYTTPEQVSRSWLLSMTEWATQPLAGAPSALWKGNKYKAGGLRKGAAAAHILVFDRKTKRVVEETVSPALAIAMRALYLSAAGRLLLREGGIKRLRKMSEKYGAYADSPESAADIPKFLATFKGQVDLNEALLPEVSAYKNFNQFFYRKLKPEARPIADADDPGVVVSAADCRLMVYNSIDDATRCWIKGRRFSLAGLLGDAEAARAFDGGSLAIFRLAPQDYHRFHLPVGGRVESITDIPGELLTVNPIAVNSSFADVFTRNKRSVLRLSAPGFGEVAYIAIGATIVGSILWTLEPGQEATKGDEAGYFAFGGSTIVVLFQRGAVTWDDDLQQNSLNSLETRVLMGEQLGRQGSGAAVSGTGSDGAAVADGE